MRPVLCLALCLLLPACATSPPSLPHDPITPASLADNAIPATPLLLLVHARSNPADDAPGLIGCGSGVLVHPRIILTAGHIVPPDPTFVVAYDGVGGAGGSNGEAIVIDRVIRSSKERNLDGSHDERWGDDWTLLVLKEPAKTFKPVPANARSGEAPPIGTHLVIAGFPFAHQRADQHDPVDRTGVLVHTFVKAPRTETSPDSPIYYAHSTTGDVRREGASGGPVFSGQTLVGVYVGHIDTNTVLNTPISRTLVIRRVPLEAIESATRELDAPR